MQSDRDGFGSGGSAVEPTLADVLRSQLQLSLREPWFAQIFDFRSQLIASLQEPWFAEIIDAAISRLIQKVHVSQVGLGFSQPPSSQSSLSQLSQSSLSSSTGSDEIAAMSLQAHVPILSEDVGSQTMQAEGSYSQADGAANLYWDVPCPCCLSVSASEAAFVEHIKLININRHLGANPNIKCVMRQASSRHRQLLSHWIQGSSWLDSVSEFVAELRSFCNPGSKKVYRPGGTGNNRKVKKFIAQLLHPAQHVGDNDSVAARQGSVVGAPAANELEMGSELSHQIDCNGSAPDSADLVTADELRRFEWFKQQSTAEPFDSGAFSD
jgi:hypothetical protein